MHAHSSDFIRPPSFIFRQCSRGTCPPDRDPNADGWVWTTERGRLAASWLDGKCVLIAPSEGLCYPHPVVGIRCPMIPMTALPLCHSALSLLPPSPPPTRLYRLVSRMTRACCVDRGFLDAVAGDERAVWFPVLQWDCTADCRYRAIIDIGFRPILARFSRISQLHPAPHAPPHTCRVL